MNTAQTTPDKPEADRQAPSHSKGLRRLLCVTTLAFTASLVGCGADGILPAQGDNPENPNPFDIILGE